MGHFHFDHVHGNQVFPEAEILAHEVTRAKIAGGDSRRGRAYETYLGSAPERILPGHGPVFTEVERIGHLQDYLEDLWSQAVTLHRQGVSEQEAVERIDLTAHAAHFPQIQGPGVNPHAVARIYELLEEGDGRRE